MDKITKMLLETFPDATVVSSSKVDKYLKKMKLPNTPCNRALAIACNGKDVKFETNKVIQLEKRRKK